MQFRKAIKKDLSCIVSVYEKVIDVVNKTQVKLGWDMNTYPTKNFIEEKITSGEMFCLENDNNIVSVAVINEHADVEYETVDWIDKNKTAVIHSLAVHPQMQRKGIAEIFVHQICSFCIENGFTSIHLDVIDTNIPAYKLYTKCGFKEISRIDMYHDSIGIRKFWMMEKILY